MRREQNAPPPCLPRIVVGSHSAISGQNQSMAITASIGNTYGKDPATTAEKLAPPEMPWMVNGFRPTGGVI